jgi:hypothetical protein
MPVGQKEAMETMERDLNAWKTIAPEKKFGGMSVSEFEGFVVNSRNARINVAEKDNQLTLALKDRDDTDAIGLEKCRLFKNGVIGDATEGENSALYEAMGYIRKDDKKSGLTRKKKKTTTPTP